MRYIFTNAQHCTLPISAGVSNLTATDNGGLKGPGGMIPLQFVNLAVGEKYGGATRRICCSSMHTRHRLLLVSAGRRFHWNPIQ
jgi:hypothetical protein